MVRSALHASPDKVIRPLPHPFRRFVLRGKGLVLPGPFIHPHTHALQYHTYRYKLHARKTVPAREEAER